MLGDHYFQRIRQRQSIRPGNAQPSRATLLELLTHEVIEPFARLSDVSALVVPLAGSERQDVEDPPPNPGHPACAEYARSDYCRESWQLHLAELRHCPESHWHKCDFGMYCALVPVLYAGRCLAVAKLNCPASIPEEDFQRQVELLDLLVRDFVSGQADFLRRLLRAEQAAAARRAPPACHAERARRAPAGQPLVERAVRYLEAHLSDPRLTVGRVARELAVNADYLSHLFVDQLGRRMSGFIVDLRVAQAKTLLATTEWQIKRIACETGHANPNWFCHVFAASTGFTPGEYRTQTRERPLDDSIPRHRRTRPAPIPVVRKVVARREPAAAAETAQYLLDRLCTSEVGTDFAGKRPCGVA